MLLGKEKKVTGCLPDTSDSQTPLQVSLPMLGEKSGFMAIGVYATVYIIGTFVTKTRDLPDPSKEPWLVMILISVTLAVAAIPEGIPLCVAISLSQGCVRRVAAVETLGSALVVCTDKSAAHLLAARRETPPPAEGGFSRRGERRLLSWRPLDKL